MWFFVRQKPSSAGSAIFWGTHPRFVILGALASVVLHGFFFAALAFFPDFSKKQDLRPDVIRVRMVSASPGGGGMTAPPPQPDQPAQKQPEQATQTVHIKQDPAPEPKPEKKKSQAPKVYKKKVAMKNKTFNRKNVVKKAIDKMEKAAEEDRPKTVTDAISRLKDKVENMTPPGDAAIAGPSGPVAGLGPGVGGIGGRALDALDIYKAEVAYRIQRNWAYPGRLDPEGTRMEAVLVIRILPSGRIGEIRFEKRSGDELLDDSSYKAVQKSNPLPELPKEVGNTPYELGLRFTPKGLN